MPATPLQKVIIFMAAMVWLGWAAFPQRSANSRPSDISSASPQGSSLAEQRAMASSRPALSPNAAQSDMTLHIRQYYGNADDAIQVRLKADRLRAWDLSPEDVINVFHGCSIGGSPRRVAPPPGVVFVTRFHRPEAIEQFILKITDEGEIVRIKDIAEVEYDRN